MTAPHRSLASGFAVVLILLTAACGGSGSHLVEEAPSRFAGMDRRTLNACAGTPTAVEDAAGGTVLHYEMSSARQVDIPRPDPGPGRVGSASDALPPPPSVTYRRNCSARFLVRDGRVVDAAFDGRAAGGEPAPAACEPFVRRCLRGG
ncbi:hypothetical protein [Marinibaculum pumilum]|uniref:hypothetical protein n=1 Tax=Marinibaculum pumilum TaxID=1766165 RepID=UPI0036D3BBA7